mmetsp:Transcript_6552/g.18276  ORF Transcript_6552/g.18276 Transcript_6552/m.18276 type:complete len:390 (+) Transcript_6552:163-1332(+)
MSRVDPELLQYQGQDRPQPNAAEHDEGQAARDGDGLRQWRAEGGGPEETGRGQQPAQADGHLELAVEELPLGGLVQRPQGQAADDADGGLIAGVAPRPDQHGEEVHDDGMVLEEDLVPGKDEARQRLHGQQTAQPVRTVAEGVAEGNVRLDRAGEAVVGRFGAFPVGDGGGGGRRRGGRCSSIGKGGGKVRHRCRGLRLWGRTNLGGIVTERHERLLAGQDLRERGAAPILVVLPLVPRQYLLPVVVVYGRPFPLESLDDNVLRRNAVLVQPQVLLLELGQLQPQYVVLLLQLGQLRFGVGLRGRQGRRSLPGGRGRGARGTGTGTAVEHSGRAGASQLIRPRRDAAAAPRIPAQMMRRRDQEAGIGRFRAAAAGRAARRWYYPSAIAG